MVKARRCEDFTAIVFPVVARRIHVSGNWGHCGEPAHLPMTGSAVVIRVAMTRFAVVMYAVRICARVIHAVRIRAAAILTVVNRLPVIDRRADH